MPMKLRVTLLILMWVLLTPDGWAQSSADVSGAADYSGIARFPGSHISDYRQSGDINYRLALGRMQRVNGRVTPGREERVQGVLTRITYQIPSGYSGLNVFEHFATQLLADGVELFRCQGRGCGSSNFWANDIFANRVLYGPEADQFYMASTLGTADNISAYVAVYVITRGNRSVYAHLDILQLPQTAEDATTETPEALALRLRQEGSVRIRGVSFTDDDELRDASGLALVARALHSDPLLRVYIVGHLSGPDTLDSLLARSRQHAETIMEHLIAEGINADRLNAQGIGPLAPACQPGPCTDRVELVLQR